MVNQEPEISLGYSSYGWAKLRKSGDKLYFGEVRIPTDEANRSINEVNEIIKALEAERQRYVENNFMSWPLLELDKAIELVTTERDNMTDLAKLKAHYAEMIPKVLEQMGWKR